MAPDFLSVLRTVEQGLPGAQRTAAVGAMTSVKDPRQEFERKVRTLLRGMTALFAHGALLNPFRAGVFAFELWSHKVLRWPVPLFMVGALVAAFVLAAHPFYGVALAMQVLFYVVGFAAFRQWAGLHRAFPGKVALYFASVNLAILAGWWRYVSGVRQEILDALHPMTASRRRIRVLDLRDTHEVGGPGKTILETFKAIDATRFELHLGIYLVKNESTDTPFVRAARACGLPVHFIRGHNQYDPRLVPRTAALVRSLGIDLVHAHEVKSDVLTYLSAFLYRAPIVTTVHGFIANTPKQRALVALDRWLLRRFNRVFVVSGKLRDDLVRDGVPKARTELVHNGLVLANYRRTGQRGGLAALAGREVTAPVIASIGRLSREKGHADLLEALGIMAAQGLRVSVVLAGDGPERPSLEAQAARLGIADAVHFVGYVDHPQRVLEETDLMVLPSHTEGLPNAALEALAMGVPVLATAVGGTPEVITDGETGRLVAPSDPEALAREMTHFLAHRDDWRRMADRGQQVIERHFDFNARTRRMEALYELVVQGGGTS